MPLSLRRQPSELRAGVASLFQGFAFVVRTPRCWPWVVVPGAVVVVVSLLLIWMSFDQLGPWLGNWLLPNADSWYARGARAAVSLLSSVLAAYLALLAAMLAAPTLSAPALEHLIRMQEDTLGAPERPSHSVWFELKCGLVSQLLALAFTVPVWLVLLLLGIALPVLAPVVVALQVCATALALAWNLLDYPLSLRGVPPRARLMMIRKHSAAVLGFGLTFVALFSIPTAGVFLLPIGVIAATRLVWGVMAGQHPELPTPPRI